MKCRDRAEDDQTHEKRNTADDKGNGKTGQNQGKYASQHQDGNDFGT